MSDDDSILGDQGHERLLGGIGPLLTKRVDGKFGVLRYSRFFGSTWSNDRCWIGYFFGRLQRIFGCLDAQQLKLQIQLMLSVYRCCPFGEPLRAAKLGDSAIPATNIAPCSVIHQRLHQEIFRSPIEFRLMFFPRSGSIRSREVG